MKVKTLEYCGQREKGKIVLKQAHALSPWRIFHYETGMRLRIGIDIPEDIAGFIIQNYKSNFRVVEDEVDDIQAFLEEIGRIFDTYSERCTPHELIIGAVGYLRELDSDVFDGLVAPPPKTKTISRPRRSKKKGE